MMFLSSLVFALVLGIATRIGTIFLHESMLVLTIPIEFFFLQKLSVFLLAFIM